ncbi:DinB family protein [Ktedonospora formicarum]|uniref:DinB-like domain-containing protein n=1 Tax=Ktedonospora formicarum TaxID=2778364 RepID=A0A8J3IBX2_9CHLR|nr:DinB family protein [Ktedonospora formicarum]GHO49458.1 hypothetical protein KSX_76210 [Ktedonospora formicarum]
MAHGHFQSFLLNLLREAQINQNAFFLALPPGELDIIGEPNFWSAKDHVAHLTFWRQQLVLRLQAHLRQEPQPQSQDFEKVNPIVFEENRYRNWPDILSESDQVYANLITLIEQLEEEDLTVVDRLPWMLKGLALYISVMGNCYEHTMIHLGYYLSERHQGERAVVVYEQWADQIIKADVPDPLKGNILYNLACFYATHDQLEKAPPALEESFILTPELREFATTDPDLVALYPTQS